MFNRTIRLLENGIKPLYVFDGKPPEMKSGELAKRKAMKERAQADMTAAAKEGTCMPVLHCTAPQPSPSHPVTNHGDMWRHRQC